MRNLKMKFRRIELNISQTELAGRAGVTRQTIGLIVRSNLQGAGRNTERFVLGGR